MKDHNPVLIAFGIVSILVLLVLLVYSITYIFSSSPGETVTNSDKLKYEVILSNPPYGITRVKISEGWLYIYNGYNKGGITFVPELK